MGSLAGKAFLFTILAYSVPIGLGWWLFGTRLAAPAVPAQPFSPRRSVWLAGILGLAGLSMLVGALWDASMHVTTGIVPGGSDFLWPPHIMIYASFLVALLVSLGAVAAMGLAGVGAGVRDPRQWFRRDPYLGAVAIAALYSIMSIPGDAIWHELFGIDLTAWSPPHIILGLTSCAVLAAAFGLLMQVRAKLANPLLADALGTALVAVMINLALVVGVLEWEIASATNLAVKLRPVWLYPAVTGGIAFFGLMMARAALPLRWGATGLAFSAYLLRLFITVGLGITDNATPHLSLLYVAGALALDLTAGRPGLFESWRPAAVFTAGFGLAALPTVLFRTDIPAFGPIEIVLSFAATLAAALLAMPAALALGRRLAHSPGRA